MMEDKKPETGITDEELMRLTMALHDDDFNFEEDFPATEVNPSKVTDQLLRSRNRKANYCFHCRL
jgi:hypothetical protein